MNALFKNIIKKIYLNNKQEDSLQFEQRLG